MRYTLAVLGVALLLSGCGSSANIKPPAELTPIEGALQIEYLWSSQGGAGVSDLYLQLPIRYHDNIGYAVDYKGYIKAFDLNTGRLRWDRHTGLELSTGVEYYNNRLYMGTREGEVVALAADDGKEIWRSQVSSEVIVRPAAAKGIVVVRSNDGKLFALDAASGERRWVYDRTAPPLTLRGNSAPVIVNDLVISGSDNGRLSALVLNNGSVFWETAISQPSGKTELERMIDIDANPVVVGNVVYAVSYQGRLAAVDISSGRILWARDMSSYQGMAIDNYRIYMTDSEGQVLALNRRTGATLWRQDKLLRRSVTQPELDGPYLVVADFNGYLHWLSRESGKIEGRKRLNGAYYLFNDDYDTYDPVFRKQNNVLSGPLVAGDRVIAVDRHGYLGAYRRVE